MPRRNSLKTFFKTRRFCTGPSSCHGHSKVAAQFGAIFEAFFEGIGASTRSLYGWLNNVIMFWLPKSQVLSYVVVNASWSFECQPWLGLTRESMEIFLCTRLSLVEAKKRIFWPFLTLRSTSLSFGYLNHLMISLTFLNWPPRCTQTKQQSFYVSRLHLIRW